MSYEMSIVYTLQDDTKNQGPDFFLTRWQKSRRECSPDLNTLPEALVGHVKREATDWMKKICGGRSLAHQKKHWIVLSLENRYIDIGIG